MKFVFPKPPTTNHIYGLTSRGKFARMYITKEGKDWFSEAEKIIKKTYRRKSPITTESEVFITVHTSTRRDAQAADKAILDSFEKYGVVENDYLFNPIHSIREKCKRGEDYVEVEIWESE